jgi:hypothetical protein
MTNAEKKYKLLSENYEKILESEKILKSANPVPEKELADVQDFIKKYSKALEEARIEYEEEQRNAE